MNRPLNTLLAVLAVAALTAPAYANPSLIDVDFPGGTLTEYVDTVRQAAGHSNIVVAPEAADIAVPPVRLKSVPLVGALEVLQGDYQPTERTTYRVNLLELGPWGVDDDETPVYRVSAEVHRRGRPSTTMVRVWCIADMADNIPPEDVLAAIETAVGLTDSLEYGEASIRFHEPTNLIIAQGHPTQLDSVQQVVGRLHEDIRARRDQGNSDKDKRVEDAVIRAIELSAELKHRTQEMEDLRTRVEAETTARQRIEQKSAEHHEMVQRYESEIAALRMQLNEANKK